MRVLSNQQKENKLTIKEQQRLVANFVPLRTKTETRKSKREKRKNDKDDTADRWAKVSFSSTNGSIHSANDKL